MPNRSVLPEGMVGASDISTTRFLTPVHAISVLNDNVVGAGFRLLSLFLCLPFSIKFLLCENLIFGNDTRHSLFGGNGDGGVSR